MAHECGLGMFQKRATDEKGIREGAGVYHMAIMGEWAEVAFSENMVEDSVENLGRESRQ